MRNGATEAQNSALEALEIKIAKFLRYGVFLAGFLILTGWLLDVKVTSAQLLAFHHYESLPLFASLDAAWTSANPARLLSYTGLFVLVSLPILRVFFTAVLFFRQREWVLACIASFVFLAIAVSCVLGIEL